MEKFIALEPWTMPHADLFRILQSSCLEYRMKDQFVSLGWFSPSQMLVLDEYCARYGVRGCHRHLCYLADLLDRAERGIMIDPALIHYSYAFCCSHIVGNTQDGKVRTVLSDEREMFVGIRSRLSALLEKQITEFRYYFPFGLPEGALKQTLGLLERVLMKDNGMPASSEEVRAVIKNCLHQAAFVNYSRLSEYASIECAQDPSGKPSTSERSISDLIHLAELCIEVLRQNEEHHAESFAWFSDLLTEHAELFWSLFAADMVAVMEKIPEDCWEAFPLFQLLNDYLIMEESLKEGKFHQQLREMFAPIVIRYVDLMEASITQSIRGVPLVGGTNAVTNNGVEQNSGSGGGGSGGGGGGLASALGNVGSSLASAAVNAASGGASNLVIVAMNAASANSAPAPIPVSSEELIWKLEALQTFIRELHWTDMVFAEHLDNRLKMMAADMIDAAAERNLECFDAWLKRTSKGCDFILPNECCNMINTVAALKANILKLCTKETQGEDMHEYHNQTEANLEKIQRRLAYILNEKLGTILEGVLVKLARYDSNTLLSSVLSLTKPTDEVGKAYVEFMRVNLEQLRQKLSDEVYVLSTMETWYMTQTRMISEWLNTRKNHSLHPYQFTCLSTIMKKMYSDFELQGISPDALDTMTYKTISQRLQVEEATIAVQPESSSSPTRSLLGTITGGFSGLSSSIPKPGFLSKMG
ncbi:secretion activator [Sparganum proliferum]